MTAALVLALSLAGTEELLEWSAPEECPNAQFMLTQINQHLSEPLVADTQNVRVRASIQPIAGTWRIDAEIDLGSKTRHEVEFGADCWALTSKLAWLIAIDIEPLGEQNPDGPPPGTYERESQIPTPTRSVAKPAELAQPPKEAKAAVDTAPPDTPAQKTGSGAGVRASAVLGLAGGVTFNLFPNIVGGVNLRGGVQLHWARLLALFDYWGGGRYLSEDRLVGAELLAWNLGVESCGSPLQSIVEVHLCVTFAAGGVRGRGFGNLDSTHTSHRPWLRTGAHVQVGWPVRPSVSLFASVGVSVPILRPEFEFQFPERFYEIPSVGAAALGGVEFRLAASGKRRR